MTQRVIGLDVGKAEHHCVALNLAGDRLVDRPLLNDEAALREHESSCQSTVVCLPALPALPPVPDVAPAK